MDPSKWRTECVGEGKEKELTSQNNDRVRKLMGVVKTRGGWTKRTRGMPPHR